MGCGCSTIERVGVGIRQRVELIENTETIIIQWNPSKPSPFRPVKVSLLEGWPHFRGEFVLKSMLWDFAKWPEYRGGHIKF